MLKEKNSKVFQYSRYHFAKESAGQIGTIYNLYIVNTTDLKCVIYYYDRNRQRCDVTEINPKSELNKITDEGTTWIFCEKREFTEKGNSVVRNDEIAAYKPKRTGITDVYNNLVH